MVKKKKKFFHFDTLGMNTILWRQCAELRGFTKLAQWIRWLIKKELKTLRKEEREN